MMRLIGAFACAALCAAVSPSHGSGSECAPSLVSDLVSTGTAKQLVTVIPPRQAATRGSLQTWRQVRGCWVEADGPWSAWVGRRGVSLDRREGDRTTPAGVFGFGSVMYGAAPDPGVRYPYRRLACGDWWVEDPRSQYYNRFHHVRCGSTPPFRVTDEDLSRSPTAYRHFAFIRYNVDPIVPGRGSGIFLHASTGRPTLGCVSLPAPILVTVLRWLRPENDPLIVIGTRAMIRGF